MCGNGLRKAIETVGIVFQDSIVMDRASSNGFVTQRDSSSGAVDSVGRFVPFCIGEVFAVEAAVPDDSRARAGPVLRNGAFPAAEVGDFIHVNPEAVDRGHFVEPRDLVCPE
eukprot:Gb_06383 [translate_table: standard]